METAFILLGLLACAVLAWKAGQSIEQAKHLSRIRDLESKYRFSQGENSGLKEKLTGLQGEVAVLHKSLEEERDSKNIAIGRMAESFKKGLILAGVVYFAVGISLGGVVSWFATGARAEAKNLVRRTELELGRQLSDLKAEVLEKRVQEMQKTLEALRFELNEERVEKTVAVTKLQILLQSLSVQKGIEGFVLNYHKLRENLNREIELKNSTRDLSLSSASFQA